MIHLKNITLSFNDRAIFNNISCIINDDDRMGLVGRNGSGKSTLLKVIAREQQLESGEIAIQKGFKVAYFAQDLIFTSEKTVLEETLSGSEIEPEDLPRAQAEAQRLLQGLGFSAERIAMCVDNLSVGWKMRVVLAKLLLQKADFYLFDEPTNHLDIVAKDWFLHFLKWAPFGFMLVCHDRYFLDGLCTKILALDRGNDKIYHGNYTTYVNQSEQERIVLESAYIQQQKEIARKQDTINRFRASAARGNMAQSMIKELARLERIELPPDSKNMVMTTPPAPPSGRHVLSIKNLSHAFNDNTIFTQINGEIERGEKIAIVAANGVGKTTLMHIIAGVERLQNGTLTLGHNVKHTLFHQDQNSVLNHKATIIEEIESAAPHQTTAAIRQLLGAFLFSNDDIYKKISVLSGGEKSRVGMAKVLLQHANFLLLDEPTNHLDMASKDILMSALQKYTGTLLFVSHDHDFINRIATRVLELTPTGLYSYSGNYDAYLYQKQFAAGQVSSAEAPVAKAPKQNTESQARDIGKKIKKLKRQWRALIKKKQLFLKRLVVIPMVHLNSPKLIIALEKLKLKLLKK
jgi:ATPase components of ABC transporters with duplicated ATPase domains